LKTTETFWLDFRYEAPTGLKGLPAGTAVEYDLADYVGHHLARGMTNIVPSVLVPRWPYSLAHAGFYNFPCSSSISYPTAINKYEQSSRLTAVLSGQCDGAGFVGIEREARPTKAAESHWSGVRSARTRTPC